MITVSVCMIVKNEENVLDRCLQGVSDFADEIIVVDTGSEDATKQIARRYTENIYDFAWCDDFSKARNYSFSKATMDYCMWLDADDVVEKEDRIKLQELKNTLDPKVSIVMMKYHTAFDEADQPTFTYYRERWVKRSEPHLWEGQIHEVIPLVGRLLYTNIAISHRKLHAGDEHRNLRIFEAMLAKGTSLCPRERFYYARELYYHKRYVEAIASFEAFLKEDGGWIVNKIDACELIGYCHYALGNDEQALTSFLTSFQYGIPRGELCCDIGHHFLDRGKLAEAIFWYESALRVPMDETSGAFIREDCYGYLPSIQLCVCYWRMQQAEKAIAYNEKAGAYKPESKEVKMNREFFENRKHTDDKEA